MIEHMESKRDKSNMKTSERVVRIETTLTFAMQRLEDIAKRIDGVDDKLSEHYITKNEFDAKFGPVKNLVYGLVSTVLTTVLIALLSYVFVSARS